MLKILNFSFKSRKNWIILIISVLVIKSVIISLQYFIGLEPCILCIYQRCALVGIACSGLIAMISPKNLTIRLVAISVWIYSSWKGLLLTIPPSPSSTCDIFIKFPNWFPLNKWIPIIFESNQNDCIKNKWYFLSLEISQWMLIIFSVYFIISLFIFFSQFICLKQKN